MKKGQVVCEVLAAVALALLVLLPHGAERWIWLRVAISIVLLAVVTAYRGAWLDVSLLGFLFVLGVATLHVIVGNPGARQTHFHPRARFVLSNHVVSPLREFDAQDEVVLLIVEKKRTAAGRVTGYETHRFDARLRTELKKAIPETLEVSIERGDGDENLLDFTEAVAGATAIYVKEAVPKS